MCEVAPDSDRLRCSITGVQQPCNADAAAATGPGLPGRKRTTQQPTGPTCCLPCRRQAENSILHGTFCGVKVVPNCERPER